MLKKYTWFILFICASLSQGCRESEEKKPVVVRPVKIFHILGPEEAIQRPFPGKVEASEKADLAFRVSGKIIEFPVKEGDQVTEGQLIAKLDPKDFEIAVAEAKSKAEYTQAELARGTILLEKQVIPQSKYDAQKTAAEVAKANLDAAEKNLEYTQLLAPFAGEISKRYVENFQTIREKDPVVRLQNRENIDVSVQLPESFLIHSRGSRDTLIEAEFDAAPGTRYRAIIKEISTQADPSTQTYKVTLTLPAPKNLNIFPGMTTTIYAKLKATGDDKDDTFLIPTSAVFADNKGKSSVWVIQSSSHTIKKQNITLGLLKGENVVVTGGLSPGQDIVAAGVTFLQEGMKVRPLEKAGE